MGYRNNVYLVLPKKVYDRCFRLTVFENATKFIDYKDENNNEYEIIIWEWVKWQNYFKEVDDLNKILDACFSTRIDYDFLRIGEETGDIEQQLYLGILQTEITITVNDININNLEPRKVNETKRTC